MVVFPFENQHSWLVVISGFSCSLIFSLFKLSLGNLHAPLYVNSQTYEYLHVRWKMKTLLYLKLVISRTQHLKLVYYSFQRELFPS